MASWLDKSFNYRGFKCIWNHEKKYFEIKEYGASFFMGFAVSPEKAKAIIDKEVGE